MSFKKPQNQFRSAPFWAFNGKLEKKELAKQISILKDMGFGGAFLHSRTGLETEYLSEEWMDLTRYCAKLLSENNMSAWLYDEDRWPSGTCSGKVTRDPHYRLKFMGMKLMPPQKFCMKDYGQEFLAAYALNLQGTPWPDLPDNIDPHAGMELSAYKKILHTEDIPDGWQVAVFYIEESSRAEVYHGYTYLDTLNRDATEAFLQSTHEKYKESCSEFFGKSIKGIFTDEPHRGCLFNGFAIENKNKMSFVPYTYKLFDCYYQRWHEKLEDVLPEIWFRPFGEKFSRVTWQYVETLQQMFLDNFAKPYLKWCKENNLILTGHILHEDSLASQTTLSGSMMRFYEFMDIPGMDNLTLTSTFPHAAIQVSSVAKQTGKKFTLSELYGATGWQATFQNYKEIGDWHALFGINFRCPHLSWYSIKGEAKRDYPASFLHQANWYKEYRNVEDYYARLNHVFHNSKPLTTALYISPIESAWGLSRYGAYSDVFSSRDANYQKLEKTFSDTINHLIHSQIDFDLGDEEILSRKAEVLSGNIPELKLGKMHYRAIIISGSINLRSTTYQLLKQFASVGGKILIVGEPPVYIDGYAVSPDFSFADVETLDKSAVILKNSLPCLYRLENEKPFISVAKQKGNDYYLFVCNFDRKASHAIKITIFDHYNIEKLNLRNGEREGILFRHKDGTTELEYSFAPSDELLLRLTHKKTINYIEKKYLSEFIPTDRPMNYSLNTENILVLDTADYYINGKYVGRDEILHLDREIRHQHGLPLRGGEMEQPWYKNKYNDKEFNKPAFHLKLLYQFNLNFLPDHIALTAESPEDFTFFLNDKQLDFSKAQDTTLDPCYKKLPLNVSWLKKGINTLQAECAFSDKINLESMFLSGNFAVQTGKICSVLPLPEKIRFGDITCQGFPFYSGEITYHIEVPKGYYDVEITDFYAECIKFDEKNIACFAPFVIRKVPSDGQISITAILTRKNTFGPLHEIPALNTQCSPGDFITSGDMYSQKYQLIPQGIFAPPTFMKIKNKL